MTGQLGSVMQESVQAALTWVRGKVPTAIGPVTLQIENAATFHMTVELPAKTAATVALPVHRQHQILLDGKPVEATTVGLTLNVAVPPGRHTLESR